MNIGLITESAELRDKMKDHEFYGQLNIELERPLNHDNRMILIHCDSEDTNYELSAIRKYYEVSDIIDKDDREVRPLIALFASDSISRKVYRKLEHFANLHQILLVQFKQYHIVDNSIKCIRGLLEQKDDRIPTLLYKMESESIHLDSNHKPIHISTTDTRESLNILKECRHSKLIINSAQCDEYELMYLIGSSVTREIYFYGYIPEGYDKFGSLYEVD